MPRRPRRASARSQGTTDFRVLALAGAMALATAALAPVARGEEPLDPLRPSMGEKPVFSVDSPIGPIEYRAGRGMHFGRTGLNIGGFTTLEFEKKEGESGELSLDEFNFLILFQPWEFVRGFAEIEIDDVFTWKTDPSRVESDPDVVIERVFGDLIWRDELAGRLGKFQTPVGRWNLIQAEPFTWTPLEPVVVETAFDEHTTGGALFGSFYPSRGMLRYWLYGQFFDPLDPSEDPTPADRSVGGRLEFDETLDSWSLGTSFLATEIDGDWSYLGGVDAEWLVGPLELTGVATIERGDIEDRNIWDIWLQGVFEVYPTVYLIGRYEYFDRSGTPGVNIGDLGITWIPRHYLRLKAIYRLSDRETDDVTRGLKLTFSVIF